MRIRLEQLEGHLAKGLSPVYLLSGDEPLQLGEAADAVRAKARAEGFTEREVMHVDGAFNWNTLAAASKNLSLFADKRLIDLRLPSAKPGADGAKALVRYTPSPDTLLLIVAGKLERAAQGRSWFKVLDKAGVVLQIWSVDAKRLPSWIGQRMRRFGLQPEPEAVQLLAERVEGNLMAAAQEIDKLLLLNGPGAVSLDGVIEAVADSARFNVFGLVDCALKGDAARTSRVCRGLREEGIAEPLVLWALTRELRLLVRMALGKADSAAGTTQWGGPDARRTLLRTALRRYPAQDWSRLLARCARADKMIKGVLPGDAWDELLDIGLSIAGAQSPAATMASD